VRSWFRSHPRAIAAANAAIAIAGAGAYLLIREDSSGSGPAVATPAPRIIALEVPVPEETGELGFPEFATKNTTRVAGADPATDAAGVALAVHPSTGDLPGPDAVTLVNASEWQAGIAAASLVAAPVAAPVLVTGSDDVPELTAAALRALDPQGSAATAGRQVFAIGTAVRPEGFDSLELEGSDPADLAAEIDRLRERLAGKPSHLLVVSSEEPALAMPAAGWAARSGDPVLFAERDALPQATAEALERHDGVPVYVLAPQSAISAKTMKAIQKISPGAERIGAEDPVENAIEFARYASGSFGWNINDPGHGFVIANIERPLDAAAAAPLSASGTWGPLLVSDDAGAVPEALAEYLLDLKPGYAGDPTRAVYNHVWLIGDAEALSVDFQGRVDELAEVVPVTSGSGEDALGPPPGRPESQPGPEQSR
jgi:hypothetical protein